MSGPCDLSEIAEIATDRNTPFHACPSDFNGGVFEWLMEVFVIVYEFRNVLK